MRRVRTSIFAFAVAVVAGFTPVRDAHGMIMEGSGEWRCVSAYVMGQYQGTDCWYIEAQGGGGGYGGGGASYGGGGGGGGWSFLASIKDRFSALLGNPVWMDRPPPPLILCSEGPGSIEREALVTATYKAQLLLESGGMPAAYLPVDHDDIGKKWLVWYQHSSGVWVGAVYEKFAPIQAQIQFQEVIAPSCSG